MGRRCSSIEKRGLVPTSALIEIGYLLNPTGIIQAIFSNLLEPALNPRRQLEKASVNYSTGNSPEGLKTADAVRPECIRVFIEYIEYI